VIVSADERLLARFTPPGRRALPEADPEVIVWTTCSGCWGQRVVFTDDGLGGLEPGRCPWCLGVGEVVRI
jgi:hypothetical protein